MKRNLKQEARLAMSLLLAAFSLSACQKEKQVQLDIETISATSNDDTVIKGELDPQKGRPDGGYALLLRQVITATPGDQDEQHQASVVRIFEDGVEIGPAHSLHQDIRTLGKGRFSHWGTDVYLSASDNTDPRTNGRKYTYAVVRASAGKPSQMPSGGLEESGYGNLIGFANVNGTTTGGAEGPTVTVTSLSELRRAAELRAPMTIRVQGTIRGSGSVYVKSDKTIVGVDEGTLDGIGLKIYESTNVIVQNLTIRYVVAGTEDNDCVNIKRSDHVWVDHCELYSDRSHGWDYWDGLIDISKGSNYITVSWNKLHDSFKGMLLGGSANDKGAIKVTVHHNMFYNIAERAPSLVAGNAHVFNNYFANNNGYSIGSRIDSIVRTDNNYFLNCHTPIDTNLGSDAPGYVSGINTNHYENSGSNDITTREVDWQPPYEYRSALAAVGNVPQLVSQGAGPVL